jgi:hypothetical protein
MKTIITTTFVVAYTIQLITLVAIIIGDHGLSKEYKEIQSKKDANVYLIPFGFLLLVYYWYKKLD